MIMLHVFNKHNAKKHIEVEVKGIFKHRLNITVNFPRLLIDFFHGNCYVSIKYDLIGN